MNLIKIAIGTIGTAVLTRLFFRLFTKNKGKKEKRIWIKVYLPYTKEDRLCETAFAVLAILAWALACWIFSKSCLHWKYIVVCIGITLFGILMLTSHFITHKVAVPEGKEHLAEEAAYLTARSQRVIGLFTMPFMAAYLIDKAHDALGITWNTDFMVFIVCIVFLAIWLPMVIIYSKRLTFDI